MSRTQAGPQYFVSIAVLLTELMKLAACLLVRALCTSCPDPLRIYMAVAWRITSQPGRAGR